MMKFALIVVLIAVALCDLDFNRVHVVDKVGTNSYLFRGNQPLNGTKETYQFAYDELLQDLTLRAKEEANSTLPAPSVYLVDVTFETIVDGGFFQEAEFWADPKNADKGRYENWVLVGAPFWADGFSPAQQKQMIENGTVWNVDQIPDRLLKMRKMLEQGPPPNYDALAVYVHCAAGCDRTGEFVGSYRLAYEHRSTLSPIYEMDVIECGRAPNYFSSGMIGWYCLTWNLYNATILQLPTVPDCLTAYTCELFGKCNSTGI